MQDAGQIMQYSISNLDLRKSILLAPVKIHLLWKMVLSVLVFTDIGGKRVKFFDIATNQVLGVLGQGTSKSVDGHSGLSCFEQPQRLCIQGKTVFLVDSQSLWLITGVNPVIFYLRYLEVSINLSMFTRIF